MTKVVQQAAARPQIARTGDGWRIEAATYCLEWQGPKRYLWLSDGAGHLWAELFMGGACHVRGAYDETLEISPPEVVATATGCRVTVDLRSSLWRTKRLVLQCRAETLEAYYELEGEGELTDCAYFGGYYLDTAGRNPYSGWFMSGARFARVFNPEPSQLEQRARPASQTTAIDVTGMTRPGKEHWFFTPAPLCYGLNLQATPDGALPAGPWLMMGLAAPIAGQNFGGYHYEATENGFYLRLSYEGHTRVEGHFTTPSVRFEFAADPYTGLQQYAQRLRDEGQAPPLQLDPKPAWWRQPIFCGWGAQCALEAVDPARGSTFDLARQEVYDQFLQQLDAQGLTPGTIVIDDKWQRTYGENEVDTAKWPDLPGWIRARHAAGQKVLLWWKAWDPEGLDPDWCVRTADGRAVTVDPGQPDYEQFLRASVRRMLSADGYNADGFKIDFTALTPSGPGLVHAGSAWGVALLHQLLAILHDEAKRTKPDALIISHTPNPYFTDVTDMIRLNDINTGAPVVPQMLHRALVAKAACPQLLIDTDNWPMPSRAEWRKYAILQANLGVPALYFAGPMNAQEALTETDFAMIRQVWQLAAEDVAA
jgi:hypothetical protein